MIEKYRGLRMEAAVFLRIPLSVRKQALPVGSLQFQSQILSINDEQGSVLYRKGRPSENKDAARLPVGSIFCFVSSVALQIPILFSRKQPPMELR